jgi:hypothetical protein
VDPSLGGSVYAGKDEVAPAVLMGRASRGYRMSTTGTTNHFVLRRPWRGRRWTITGTTVRGASDSRSGAGDSGPSEDDDTVTRKGLVLE